MSLNKNKILFFFTLFICVFGFSQQVIDTISRERLDEVVVTGQINPQSIDKSVFEVKLIDRREIQKRAGVNLADLLNQTLNLNIIPNLGNGRSEVSLFGLDGQYFKILINNVPLVNESGFGNGADLSLINLDDVEQIEIIEGSMGVQYGSNAVTGVINIITRKSSRHETELSLYFQEETVGSEYGLLDEGRHIQSFNAKHYLTDNLFTSMGAVRNDFTGFLNNQLGEDHDDNDGRRGYEWLPKVQVNPNLLIRYDNDQDFSISYNFDYYNETINRLSPNVNLNTNSATDTNNPTSQDNELTGNRFIHTLNVMGKINKRLNYNIVSSFQQQTNDIERWTSVIRTGERLNIENEEYLSRKVFFTRATLSNLYQTERFNLQVGYEMSLEEGFGDNSAIGIVDETEVVRGKLNNYDGFLSAEFKFSDRFSIRPGTRVAFTNLFGPQYIFSLSTRYKFDNGLEFRTVVGSANKTPSYDELFYFFVDSNHNVQGNVNLNPEEGYSIFAHLKKPFKFSNGLTLNSKISASYIDLKDKIELITISFTPFVSRYENIDDFRSLNFMFENEIRYKRLTARLGLSLQGVSQVLNNVEESNDDFLYNFSSNFNINYTIPNWGSNITLYYKYRGRVQQFLAESDAIGNTTYVIGQTEGFSWLDLNFEKAFSNRRFVATVGARNLLDVDFANTNALPGGAHSDAPVAIPLAYGRSFFLKLNYNLNF